MVQISLKFTLTFQFQNDHTVSIGMKCSDHDDFAIPNNRPRKLRKIRKIRRPDFVFFLIFCRMNIMSSD